MAMHRVPLTTSERKCCIKGCGSINMFKQCHQFPATLERREAWLRAIGPHMDDDLIGQPPEKFKSRVVCVEHFVPSYFSGASSRFLKRSAIPTQFPDLATLNSSQTRSSNNNQAHNGPLVRLSAENKCPTNNQAPAVNQGMVIPKEKIQSNTNLYQINKRTTAPTEGKRPATAHPTLLVEPLQTKDSHTKKRPFSSSTESKTELPMFYISSMYGNDGRKHKPALKITKVFPNRKEQPTECITDSKSVNDQLATVYMQESLHANFDADPEYFEFDREPESQGLTDVQSDNSQLAGDNSQMDADDSNADTEESRLEEDNSQVNLIVMQENENADTGNVSMKLIKYVNNNPENIEEPAINTNTDIAAVITHAPYEVPPVVRRVDSTPELPECVQYVLLGGGTACVAALKGIRKHDHKAKVLIVSQEYSYPYDRRMLSKSRFWKSGDFSKEPDVDQLFQGYGESSSLYHNPESYYIDPIELTGEAGGVGVARGYTVRRVDPVQHSVVLSAIGRPDKTVVYGKCLIATGVHPKNIPVLENSSREVQRRCIMLRCIGDAMRLWKMLERARSIVVVGGGFLGSEMACALAERLHGTDTRVTLIFRESGLLWHILPDYLARWSTPQLAALGINVCPKTEILNAYMSKNRVTLELSNAEMVEADVIVVCAGSIPNTDFAAASHIETHPQLGGIIVNSEFCVQKDLYAAGDVACFYDPRVGRRRVEHWQQAVQSGFIAGVMMAGAEAARLRHSEISSRLLPNLRYEAIGIIDSNLEMMGAFPNLSHGNDKNYDEGVVFYLQQREIVGVLLWNLHNRLKIARQLLNDEQKQKEEINELADLFIVHGSDEKSQDCTASLELDNEPTSQCYECAACDEIFANKSEIIEHIATSHRQEYCCEICTRKFTTKLQLKKHYSTHFNCRPSVRRVRKKELTQPTEFNLANQFKCVYCVKSFRFMADLKMHLRKDHPGRTLAQRRILVKGKPLVMTNLKVIRKVIP